jgi:hypothetical protein
MRGVPAIGGEQLRTSRHLLIHMDRESRREVLTCVLHAQVMIDKQLLDSVLADLVLLHSEPSHCGLTSSVL